MEPLSERVICGFRVREFKTLDSTSSYLKRLAKTDGRHKDAAVALSQTAGRGRSGRSFFSPESGLYLSVLLKKGLEAETAELITPAAAVAVAEALEETGSPRAGIKWVNDIYIGGKKVCGILTETGGHRDRREHQSARGRLSERDRRAGRRGVFKPRRDSARTAARNRS